MQINGNIPLVAPEILRENEPVHRAFELTAGRYGAVLTIVDQDDRLTGVVTPGDLRKAVLRGMTTTTPVRMAMNRDPVSLHVSELKESASVQHVLELIRGRYGVPGMLYAMIPVIDDERRILGLVNLEALSRSEKDLNVLTANRSALVVGGAGYIGSLVIRDLLAAGWSVKVLDKLLYGDGSLKGITSDRFTLVRGDAKDMDTIVEAIDGVDAVVYLAELVGDPAVSTAPQTALKTNFLAVTSLAQLCAYLNVDRFVYTSSCSVYGASADPDVMLDENSRVAPVSLYGKIKVLVEEAVLAMCNVPNRTFSPTILRLGTVFGHSARPRFDLVVNTFVKNAIEKGWIEIFGGNQWRPQVDVSDVSRAIVTVLDAPLEKVRAEIFNVGSTRQNHTITELGEIAAQVFPDLEVRTRSGAGDPRNYRVDCDKFRDVLGYDTVVDVLGGMEKLKEAVESGALGDLDAPRYNNIRTVEVLEYQ